MQSGPLESSFASVEVIHPSIHGPHLISEDEVQHHLHRPGAGDLVRLPLSLTSHPRCRPACRPVPCFHRHEGLLSHQARLSRRPSERAGGDVSHER